MLINWHNSKQNLNHKQNAAHTGEEEDTPLGMEVFILIMVDVDVGMGMDVDVADVADVADVLVFGYELVNNY